MIKRIIQIAILVAVFGIMMFTKSGCPLFDGPKSSQENTVIEQVK